MRSSSRTSSTRCGRNPFSSATCADADRGLVEHPVHAGRTVGVRGDLGDEQQAIGHRRQTYLRQPKPGGCGNGNTSPRPVRAIDWYRRRA